MHVALGGVDNAAEVTLQQDKEGEPWEGLDDGPGIGNAPYAVEQGLHGNVDGHCGRGRGNVTFGDARRAAMLTQAEGLALGRDRQWPSYRA